VAQGAEPVEDAFVTDHYGTLGISRDATTHEIREAYWRQVSSYPVGIEPDDRLGELRDAYETLTDPSRRAEYDASGDGTSAPVAPPVAGLPSLGPLPDPPPMGSLPQTVTMEPVHESRNPLDRLTARLPRAWRVAIDWVVTIAGAILIVLAIKAWVVNPYRIPSSSMEPTLHCARPGSGCEARLSDRVLANRFIYHFRSPRRGEIIVFNTPTIAAQQACNASGTFVKRLIGLPGETVSEKNGFIFINGKRLNEPYIKPDRRDRGPTANGSWPVPAGHYFFMGDNRRESCDSRRWGSVPRSSLIGEVFMTYWPPNRIAFHAIVPGLAFGLLLVLPLRRRRRRSGAR
jgi:signal peptidase I